MNNSIHLTFVGEFSCMSLNTYQEQNVVLSMPTLLIEETNHLAANLGISYNDFYIQAIFAYLYRDVEDPIAIKLDQLYARSPELSYS